MSKSLGHGISGLTFLPVNNTVVFVDGYNLSDTLSMGYLFDSNCSWSSDTLILSERTWYVDQDKKNPRIRIRPKANPSWNICLNSQKIAVESPEL